MAGSWMKRHRSWILWFLVPPVVAAGSPAKDQYAKPERMTVTVLAISTRTHHGYAGDEDAYLATLTDRQGHRQLIRLADWTVSGTLDVPAMSVGKQFRLIATRTPWCDSSSQRIFLPVSAGDRSQFFPSSDSGQDDAPIACYHDQHGSIRDVSKRR